MPGLRDLGPACPGLLPAKPLPHSEGVGVWRLTREANVSSCPRIKADLGCLSPRPDQNPPSQAFPERCLWGSLSAISSPLGDSAPGDARAELKSRCPGAHSWRVTWQRPWGGGGGPSCQRCIWPRPGSWLPLGPCAEPRRPWRPGPRRSQGTRVSVGIQRTDVVGREGWKGFGFGAGRAGGEWGRGSESPDLEEPSWAGVEGWNWLLEGTSNPFRVPIPVGERECVPRPGTGKRRRGMNGW